MESLREEVDMEINNENKGSKILADLSSLNLNRLDHVSPDVVLCAVIVKSVACHWFAPLLVLLRPCECYLWSFSIKCLE